MLRKESVPKKSRFSQNSSTQNLIKNKNSFNQTDFNDSSLILLNEDFQLINDFGKISKKTEENYKNAINYINKLNNLMNNYLINKKNKKDIKINKVTNFMTIFNELIKIDDKIDKKNSFTQTKRDGVPKKLPEIVESSEEERIIPKITKSIQEKQYRSYTPKKSASVCQNQLNFQENIRKTTSNIFNLNTNSVIQNKQTKISNMFNNMKQTSIKNRNIFKNIENNNSSNSSIILSDKNSEINEELDEFSDINEDLNEQINHPLNLNGRDLNSRDKEFINSIGIFTENGGLKEKAKNYLENKDYVKKGEFRKPRVKEIIKKNQSVTPESSLLYDKTFY